MPEHLKNQNCKILIVEDDPIVALDLSYQLKEMGCYIIGTAKNHTEAVELMFLNPADILLCDINLKSHYTGIDVVRSISQTYDPVIIYLTALEDMQTLETALATNPQSYLLKPYRYSELYVAVKVALKSVHQKKKKLSLQVLNLGDGYQLYIERKTLIKNESVITLTKNETKLVLLLASNLNQMTSFEMLAYSIWPEQTVCESNRRTLIYRLHSKLEYKLITSLSGVGCHFTDFPPTFI